MRDWALTVKELVDVHYPEAEMITLVMDNLSTHKKAALLKSSHQRKPSASPTNSRSTIPPSTAAGSIWPRLVSTSYSDSASIDESPPANNWQNTSMLGSRNASATRPLSTGSLPRLMRVSSSSVSTRHCYLVEPLDETAPSRVSNVGNRCASSRSGPWGRSR